MTNEMEDFIKLCPECQKTSTPLVEPMLETILPNRPWESVTADLFELKGVFQFLIEFQ